ncbi:MAG TPA: ribulose-phosphate 3-epimerase [Firmicutes bacterium]|nr:ribulose-phosphate 3-epimerase [Bacillota bacterium]
MGNSPVKIAPSILSCDFARLAEDVGKVSSADLLHVDVMDGHFVPNITVGPQVVASLRKVTHLPLDVHLMIEYPEQYIEAFAEAGSAIITVHAEATRHLHRLLQRIKKCGPLAGVALNPSTPLSAIEHVLDLADLILVMTVNPGFGGQAFIETMLPKIRKVRGLVEECGRPVLIEVDGGIGPATAGRVVEAGATVLVAGSSVFNSDDPGAQVERIRRAALDAAAGLG